MEDAGYTYLRENLDILVPPLALELKRGTSTIDRTTNYGYGNIKILAKNRKIGTTSSEHIEVAIKYQGINLSYLSAIFQVIDINELTAFIKEQPTSTIRRCIWYIYEWLMEKRLELPDLTSVSYTKLLLDKYYYTSNQSIRDKRTKVENNLIGNKDFCPVIRKTNSTQRWAKIDMLELAREELANLNKLVDIDLIGRSVNYLYTRETKSSTDIEKEDSREEKTVKFLRVLKSSGRLPITKKRLIKVQNQIVKQHKTDGDYRFENVYVGETNRVNGTENIHYIAPPPEQVPNMMKGLIHMHDSLMASPSIPAMMHAAIVSFGFVYIHPFSDGNGRTHRYLMHDILKARSPKHDEMIIPVSAAILQRQDEYASVLESFSKSVMTVIDYDLDLNGEVIIHNDIQNIYRYPDLTLHVEFLYKMMELAITQDLMKEIIFLVTFDAIKELINNRFDIPNTKLNLLVNLLLQNNGKLSQSKKKQNLFNNYLTEKETNEIEEAVSEKLQEIEKTLSVNKA